VANWAASHASWLDTSIYYPDDCTDFVSRALYYGGGQHQVAPSASKQLHHDANPGYWYFQSHIIRAGRFSYVGTFASNSWGVTVPNYNFQQTEGAVPFRDPKNAIVGDIAYALWAGGKKNVAYPGWSGPTSPAHLSHAAIVTKVSGSNVYISQESVPRVNEPIYKIKSSNQTWQGQNPSLEVYFLNTALDR
jgi:hypothetical protein